MRYADGRRTIVEWRDPSIDPVHNRRLDNGFFRTFGEPECQLMGVQHQWAAQRDLTAPPTAYTVVGPRSDPWLAAAGLAPGDVIPGVVGYEWDSLVPGCFAGQVVPLMTTAPPGIRRRSPTAQTWSGQPRRAEAACSRWARWSWPGRSMTWTGAPPTRSWSRSSKQPSTIGTRGPCPRASRASGPRNQAGGRCRPAHPRPVAGRARPASRPGPPVPPGPGDSATRSGSC